MAANTVTIRLFRNEEVYEDIQVDRTAARESAVLNDFIDTKTDMELIRFPIPYDNIKSGKILEMVFDYCKFHAHAKSNNISEDNLKIWDTQFVENILAADKNQATFCHILLAANFLDIRDLVDLLCKAAANLLKDKSVEEMRLMFKIENDFSEEEEEKIMRETAWAYT